MTKAIFFLAPGSLPALLVVAGSLVVLGAAVFAAERQAGGGAQGSDPKEVLAEVPARGREGLFRRLELLGRQLDARPRDANAAAEVARLALAGARRSGDPRLLGRAQAALAPWWGEAAPPGALLLLRATVKQARHDFAGALADVERLLRDHPHDADARLLQAVVLTVTGRHAEARDACLRLAGFTRVACAAPANAALGAPAEALASLDRLLTEAGRTAGEAAWVHALAGEIAYWAGRWNTAEDHLAAALALDPGDGYARLLLADLLLDRGRAGQVRALLAGREDDDGALLRLALAERALGGARAGVLAATLGERQSAARRRGDDTHAREEARFQLLLAGDPAAALVRARQSWAVQREPWDARLVLAAARASGTREPEVEAFVAARSGWHLVKGLP